jgi:hypothetical protein
MKNLLKTIKAKIKTNILETPHPTLVACGLSIAIAAGLATLYGDPGSTAHAVGRITPHYFIEPVVRSQTDMPTIGVCRC